MSLLARVNALESQSGKVGDGLMQLTVYTWSVRTKQQLHLCGPGIVMGRVEFEEATKFECSAIDARRRRTKVEILCTLHTWYRKLSYEREAKSIEQRGLDLQAQKFLRHVYPPCKANTGSCGAHDDDLDGWMHREAEGQKLKQGNLALKNSISAKNL
ncbi:hypothetical protein ACJRO7_019429 [Eucalyptus globulus]|uniref:Uncharacterized protein n=1 Tax=Eucalyptus globulus TaxID=34317 RepID=A0ABD3KGE4_EUCGL